MNIAFPGIFFGRRRNLEPVKGEAFPTWRPVQALFSGLLVAAITLLGLYVLPLTQANLVMLYLLVVVFSASHWGRVPAAVAALFSVLAYDTFFVPPLRLLTFSVGDTEHFLTFLCFLTVGFLVAHWTSQIRLLARERVRLVEETGSLEILREKERLQEALLNSISHDLQTPISSIVGALDGLCDTTIELDADSRRSLLETARQETHRLHGLVRNLLDLTRLESGPRLKLSECDVSDLIGAALGQMEEVLENRVVDLHIEPEEATVKVDFVLFNQVLVNLVENAVKYSPGTSAIALSFRIHEGHPRFEVSDEGCGIPEGDREIIFEKFFRRSDVNTAGSGLGLAISRGLVEAHGGTLTAQDNRPRGTTMVIELPQEPQS